MGLPLQTFQYNDNSGGLDLKSSPIKASDDDATASLNVDYSTDGAVFTRNGSSRLNSTQLDQLNNLGFYDYRKSDSTTVQVLQNGSKIYHDLSTPVAQVTGLNPDALPDFDFIVTNDDEYLLWGNGIDDNLKFNGTAWTKLSLPTFGNPTVVDQAVGVLPAGEYSYYTQEVRTISGVIVQRGDLNPVAQSVTIAINRQIRITRAAITDTQTNGWVILRKSPTSIGIFYEIVDGSGDVVIVPSATTFYDDNIATDGTIEAEFDDQPAPKSAILEVSFGGLTYYVDSASSTDLYESKAYKPWNVPSENFWIADGPINCLKRIYNILLISTSNGSLWILGGPLATNEPKRISSNIGILNNRCVDGPGPLYLLATNKKFYTFQPTDFSTAELRITEPFSIRIEPLIGTISNSALDKVQVTYYSSANQGKLMVTCPIGISTNNYLIVYNETQTFQKQKPCWQLWDNIDCASLGIFKVSGAIGLYAGDYNGFLWKLDDTTTNGDGAQVNGTATSGSTTTINDLTQNWTVDAYIGIKVRGVGGTGEGQAATITSNTATQLVFPAVSTAFNATSEYSIGAYDNYQFTNWKSVTGSYDALKQLWFIICNLNASGDYNIELIIQFDFDTTLTNQTVLLLNLEAANTIWGEFIWGQAIWGSQSVFQDRLRVYGRFYAVRFGFRSTKAGQPFQLNGFSVSAQDKGLFYRGA